MSQFTVRRYTQNVFATALCSGYFGMCLTMMAAPLNAAEYGFEYGVEAGYEYNDNVRLLPDDEIDISGSKVSIPATLTSKTERLETSLDGALTFSRFDQEQYNSDDQSLEGRAEYQLERGQLEGYAGIIRDTTRDSEFLDTGAVGLSAVRREQMLAGFSGRHLFSEMTGVSAGVDYVDTDYDGFRQQPFTYGTGFAGLVWQTSERSLYRLQAYGSHYESDGLLDTQAEGIGAQIGLETQLSQPLSLKILAGWVELDSDYRGVAAAILTDSTDDQFLLDALLEYKLPRSRIRLNATSMPRPSADGYLQATNQLEMTYRYELSERTRFNLYLTAGQRDPIDDQFQSDRDYARARLRLDYRIAQSWYLTADYTYSYQDREVQDGNADSNAVVIGVKFQPQKSVWSR